MSPAKAITYADHRRADDVLDARAFACQARGCPLRWSVDDGASRLCSAHAGKLPKEWPAITEQLRWREAEAAPAAARAAPRRRGILDHYPGPPSDEHRERLARLRARLVERMG